MVHNSRVNGTQFVVWAINFACLNPSPTQHVVRHPRDWMDSTMAVVHSAHIDCHLIFSGNLAIIYIV